MGGAGSVVFGLGGGGEGEESSVSERGEGEERGVTNSDQVFHLVHLRLRLGVREWVD